MFNYYKYLGISKRKGDFFFVNIRNKIIKYINFLNIFIIFILFDYKIKVYWNLIDCFFLLR